MSKKEVSTFFINKRVKRNFKIFCAKRKPRISMSVMVELLMLAAMTPGANVPEQKKEGE